MSEYKRLISYIYNYEKGLKKNNVGFTKIELRNGQCKISVNIKAASLNGKKLKTYLFYRDDHKMIQILLVEAIVKNGVFEWKGITNENNIMNTGHNFDEMSGLTLFYSVDKFYATEWDDRPIKLDYLYEWDEISKNQPLKISKKIDGVKTDKKSEAEIIAKKSSKEEVKKESKVIMVPKDEVTYMKEIKEAEEAVTKSQEEIVRSILRSIDSGLEIFRNSQLDTQATNSNVNQSSDEIIVNSDSNQVEQLKAAELDKDDETAKLVGYRFINWYRSQETGFRQQDLETVNRDQSNNDAPVLVSENQIQVMEDNDEEVSTVSGNNENESDAEQLADNLGSIEDSTDEIKEELVDDMLDEVAITESCAKNLDELFEEDSAFCDSEEEKVWNDRLEEAVKKKVSTAERILQKYPAIYPFEDNEILACVRIEPGDIGLFPIENWVLGNNSFLLHGYYNFRHLIFAKRKVLDEEEFILGVPGIYQNREKFMAKMFGFTQFKCTKNTEQKTGEFGYWYIKINM